MKFCRFIASVYPHMSTNFRWFTLILNKMALIFLGVLIVFTVSSFEFQQVRLPWLHRSWWVAPIHPNSIHWISRFGGNAEVLTKPATEAKTSCRVLKCTLVNLVCVTGESHWQHCERLPVYHHRLQARVSTNNGHFEYLMS